MNRGVIGNCYATGPVTGGESSGHLGGLCGWNRSGAITNCYATGPVTGGDNSGSLGGLCGVSNGAITNCYATGSVTGRDDSNYLGGLCGRSNGTISNCFWDEETSGMTHSDGGTGKTTLQMKTKSTFTDAGWDFARDDGDWWSDWYMPSIDYPKLNWQPKIAYDGLPEISLPLSEYSTVQIDVYSPDNEAMNWTMTGYESCQWITSLDPNSGSSTGPMDRTTITIDIDSIDLSVGDYTCELTLTAENGVSLHVPVLLRVYNRVDFEELALLSQYWLSSGCDETQACSSADWYIDGTINNLDFQQLALSWLAEEIVIKRGWSDYLEDFSDGQPVEGWAYNSTGNGRIQVIGERLRMDCSRNGIYSLNEAVLHIDLSGQNDILLSFWQAESDDEQTSLPASFTGSVNGDGVAVSSDGVNWTTVVNASVLDVGIAGQTYTVDLDLVGLEYTSDFQIKFQQYDTNAWSTDGREWDDIQIYKAK